MGDAFDHSMGESHGSDGGSHGGDPPDLPTILHEGGAEPGPCASRHNKTNSNEDI